MTEITSQKHTNPITKWEASSKNSRVLAIAANCASCVGCTADYKASGMVKSIRECSIKDCPLYGFRPYK